MEKLTTSAIIETYLNAVSNKKFDDLGNVLNANVVFKGPFMEYHTLEEYIVALQRLSKIFLKFDIKAIISDGLENCAFYELIVIDDGGTIPCAEWLKIEDGKITDIRLLFNKDLFIKMRAAVTK